MTNSISPRKMYKAQAKEGINERFFDQEAALTLHPFTFPLGELSLNIMHIPSLNLISFLSHNLWLCRRGKDDVHRDLHSLGGSRQAH